MMELGLLVFFFLLAAALVAAAARVVRVVPQATVMIVERLGRFYELADSGLHVLVPFTDRPRGVNWQGVRPGLTSIDLREQFLDFPLQAASTRDNVQIAVDTLLSRMPNLRLRVPPERLRWRPSMILRGPDALPGLF